MINIRPVTDLRYRFPEIEGIVNEGQPVYLTKNGYGTMVVISLEAYSRLVDGTEAALDEAEHQAGTSSERLSHDSIFSEIRRELNGQHPDV